MQQIAKTKYYTLAVDTLKNRLYSSKAGFWDAAIDRGQFLHDLEQALRQVSEGFTMLSDLAQLQVMSPEWVKTVIATQKRFTDAGCFGKALIFPDTMVATLQAKRILQSSGMRKKTFPSQDAAEAWLDALPNPPERAVRWRESGPKEELAYAPPGRG